MPLRLSQAEHSSRWSPRAALRQRSIAESTLRCCPRSQPRLFSMNLVPAARTRSATSSCSISGSRRSPFSIPWKFLEVRGRSPNSAVGTNQARSSSVRGRRLTGMATSTVSPFPVFPRITSSASPSTLRRIRGRRLHPDHRQHAAGAVAVTPVRKKLFGRTLRTQVAAPDSFPWDSGP